MRYTTIDKLNCCLVSQKENTASCDFKTNTLKLGKCCLSQSKIKDISFILAHDLLEYANNGGDIDNLLAKAVYVPKNDKLQDNY